MQVSFNLINYELYLSSALDLIFISHIIKFSDATGDPLTYNNTRVNNYLRQFYYSTFGAKLREQKGFPEQLWSFEFIAHYEGTNS